MPTLEQVRPKNIDVSQQMIRAFGVMLCCIFAAVFAVLNLQPKATQSNSGHLRRVWAHVDEIARSPHALGTADHERVYQYILDTLRNSHLSPTVQVATSILDAKELYRVAQVKNVVARVSGRVPGPAVLVVSHYDSAPLSRGAADDGAAVACLLELAGDLQRGPAPLHDVIFLFTDGEEWGLLGARSFLADPLSQNVAVVVNVDARGTAGRPVLIETSGDEMRLISLLNRSKAALWAASYVKAGYRATGNDTDFSVFAQQSWPGYNIAFFDEQENYHTSHDEPSRLDPRTLAQLDTSLQRLVGTLIDADLREFRSKRGATFSSLPGGWVIAVPSALNRALALLVVVLALIIAVRARHLWKEVLDACGRSCIGIASAVALVAVSNIGLSHHLGGLMRWSDHDGFFWAALVAVAGLTLLVFSWRRTALDPRAGAVALIFLLTGTGCVAAFALPDAAFLISVPAVIGCLVILAPNGFRWIAYLVPILAFFWMQTMWQLAGGLGLRGQWVVLPLAALLAVALLLTSLHRVRLARGLAVGLILLAVGTAVTARMYARFDENHPQADHLLKAVDLESQTARWFTYDDPPDRWNGEYIRKPLQDNLSTFLGGQPFPGYSSPSPFSHPMAVSKLGLSSMDRNRAVLNLAMSPSSSAVRVDFYSEGEILGAKLGDNAFVFHSRADTKPGQASLTLVFLAPPKLPLSLFVTLANPHSLAATVVDVAFGQDIPTRTAGFIGSPQSPTDGLFARQSIDLIKEH